MSKHLLHQILAQFPFRIEALSEEIDNKILEKYLIPYRSRTIQPLSENSKTSKIGVSYRYGN